MTILSNYQLKMYANKFLQENYGMEFIIPLELNSRLRKSCGRFISISYRDGRPSEPKVVELNKYFVENNEPTVVLDVLRHELVHYALFMQGKPNSDGHPVFERELKRLGIVSQSTIDKYDIESKKRNVYRNFYQCANPSCGVEYRTGKALKHGGIYHRCSACKGRLIDKGRKLVATV
jgi:SprT-like protein